MWERSDLKKEKPPKGFERSDKWASVICSPGRRRRTESRLLEPAERSGTRRACGGRAAETTGGESFGRSLRRSNDSPEGAAVRADWRRAHLASGVGRPRTRLEEINSRAARHELQQRINLRKDAGAGRAGAASLPRGETFPLHQAPAKRDQATSDTESAPICTGLPGTHKASCALPRCTAAGGSLRTRPKRGAQQRARCGASGDSGPERLHHVTIEATSQRGELSFPICGTAAARICRDGAYRLMEGRFRGTR